MTDTRNLTELLDALNAATRKLERLIRHPHERDGLTVPQRIKESYNGWPSGSGFDSTSRRATDRDGEPLPNYSDPTGDAGTRTDQAHTDERQILRDLRAGVRSVENAVHGLDRYELRDPNILEREATNDARPAGCQSCARIQGPRGGAYWSPIYRDTVLANGTRTSLCQACYSGPDGARHTGQFPPVEAVQARRDGKRYRGKVA